MKKNIILILSFLLLFISILFYLEKRSVFFLYVNPYSETSGFSYISKTLLNLHDVLSLTKMTVKNDGYDIRYLYQNPYGSGFLKNNPIPNDLDFAVGVYLGDFEYNGENSLDIAMRMFDAIRSFYYNLAINLQFSEQNLYLSSTPMSVLSRLNKFEQTNINDIISALDYVINKENYVKFTYFDNIIGVSENLVKMPYVMNHNEILLQELRPLILYSDEVVYNDQMNKFLREISFVPEFYARIKHNGKYYDVELVPEAFKGTRLQLSRRCFASTVFSGLNSFKFLRNVSWLVDDNQYIKYRLLSYKRHIQEIDKLIDARKSPVKILKRVMQVADLIKPLLAEEEYSDISKFVVDNLNNPDIQLLNDYLTIYSNVANIYRFDSLKGNLLRLGKLQDMSKLSEDIVSELEQRGNISKTLLVKMKNINAGFRKNISQKQLDLEVIEFLVNFENTEIELNTQIFKLLDDASKINDFLTLNTKILKNSGYHEVLLYWLNDTTLGVVIDDFTKSIGDLDNFAKINDLPDIDYKLVTMKQIPPYSLKFKLYVYDGIKTNKLIDSFMQDKNNFNIKFEYNFEQ